MHIQSGTPNDSGWYLNVISRTGRIGHPDDFIGLWADYFNIQDGTWAFGNDCCDFWANLPRVMKADGVNLINIKGSNESITLNDGLPGKPGNYLIALVPAIGLPWYLPSYIENEFSRSLKVGLQSDRFVDGFANFNLTSHFCEDEDSIIGWATMPELMFPDGTIIK